jgi:hypothetical protein
LGTLDVRGYLEEIEIHRDQDLEIKLANDREFSTRGPRHRFNGILFIEKEGFLPLFQAVKLAERFDIAIMSTKGMSVTASRMLIEQLCAEYDIPLLGLHDFDKSGFSIVGTLQRDTRRYTFEREIQVIDLGLRLNDVHQRNLESEDVAYGKSDPEFNLRENGATDEEIAFLCDRARSSSTNYVGKRVELNAFASGDFIEWIEAGLVEHGIKKVIPDADTLETAFRRAATLAIVGNQLKEIIDQAKSKAARLKIPKSLERQIRARLKSEPAVPWDRAVADLASQLVRK